MKHTFFYNIYVWAVCLVLFALPAGAQHIRVVPQQVSVRNDSLQLLLDMDLEAVNVSASTAVIFTPQLLGPSNNFFLCPLSIIMPEVSVSVRTAANGTCLPAKNLPSLICASAIPGIRDQRK